MPTGKPVMVDGKLWRGKWSDAAEAEVPGGARLYIETSGNFVYVAVQFPAGRSGFTDIYITSEDGGIYDLHASAKLGERRLDEDGQVAGVEQLVEQPGVGGVRTFRRSIRLRRGPLCQQVFGSIKSNVRGLSAARGA